MTTHQRWQEIDRIFAEALEREPATRVAFLDAACDGDEELRHEVESLLAHDLPGSLVGGQPVEEATRLLLPDRDQKLQIETIGPYQIVRSLGVGGMGHVYLAHDSRLNRPVAVKLLSFYDAAEKERIRRFRQEALAASALNHPNILTIYEIGEFEGHNFIAAEFVDGQTLQTRIGPGPISVAAALDIAIQVASALAAAHAAGIVHRDIKPANVMVRDDGLVKVLDFGIAKYTQEDEHEKETLLTLPGAVIGTAAYMSPEQARGNPVDPRTDIWSLGVILYEMVTGNKPFQGDTSLDLMSAVIERNPPPFSECGLVAPESLERIVFKALKKDRNERYQTANEIVTDLKQLRQTLERAGEQDQSASSPSAASQRESGGSPIDPKTATVLPVPTAGSDSGPSSAQYVVNRIGRPKPVALVVLVIIVSAAAILAYRSLSANKTQPIQSIAVLPFINEGGSSDTEYLSDGISESLINNLSKLPGVKVIARSSSFQYKGKDTNAQEVASALGVEAILTGRVLQRGDNLQISVELVNARDRTQVWGEQYNRKAGDLLQVQAEISKEIGERLRVRLTPAEQQKLDVRETASAQAYQLFLKGRYFWNKKTPEGHQKSLAYFNEAIETDPNYALAYVGLADAYYSLPFDSDAPPRDAFPKAKAAAMRALEIDDQLAEAHTSLASIHLMYDWDFSGADKELKHAISLNPNYPIVHQRYARYLSAMERHEEAVLEAKRARELDPLSLTANTNVGQAYFWAHQYDRAIDELRISLEIDPDFWIAHLFTGKAYAEKRMYPQALNELKKAREFSGSSGSSETISMTGYIYAVSGRHAEAQQILQELRLLSKQRYVPPFNIAIVYVGLGDKDQAFEWLEKAYVDRNQFMNLLKVEPKLDGLRADPRFADLMRRVGLPP